MSVLLGLLSGLLKLAAPLAKMLADKNLLDAGAAARVGEINAEVFEIVKKVRATARAVKHDARSVLDDPDRRGRDK